MGQRLKETIAQDSLGTADTTTVVLVGCSWCMTTHDNPTSLIDLQPARSAVILHACRVDSPHLLASCLLIPPTERRERELPLT